MIRRTWIRAAGFLALPLPALAQMTSGAILETVGSGGRELAILRVDAPGFQRLSLRQKKLAYCLYRAALAGRDIGYRQNHRYALEIRDLFEAIHQAREHLDPGIRAGVEEYLTLLWAHNGPYRHWESVKFVPDHLDFAQLMKAVETVRRRGQSIPLAPGETLTQKLQRLRPHIFDAMVERVQINPVPGADPIATSSNGFYDPGLTLPDIASLPLEVQSRPNVRFSLGKDSRGRRKVRPQVFRIGGAYGIELARIVFWLRKALPHAEAPDLRRSIEALIRLYRTGKTSAFQDHMKAWIRSTGPVDYLHGFLDIYKDPRGVLASFEANVSVQRLSSSMQKLCDLAPELESRMPWDAKWRQLGMKPPAAAMVDVLAATGFGGPISENAYNFPDSPELRESSGSKNVFLANVMETTAAIPREAAIPVFYRAEDQPLIRRYGSSELVWFVAFHEVIGHGSGKPDPSLHGEDPSIRIGPVFAALEECRADAVALYAVLDPSMAGIGMVPAEEQRAFAKAMYLRHLTAQIKAQGSLEGDVIREAHQRSQQVLLSYLTEPGAGRGVRLVIEQGDVYVQVDDLAKARAAVGELLGKLQTIKSLGDRPGAEALFERYGTRVDRACQASAKARLASIRTPKAFAIAFPFLVPVFGWENGRRIWKDVELVQPVSFASAMLEYKRLSRSRG